MDNFVWALQCLQKLLVQEDVYPEVVVIDRDLALLNAIREVFPESKHLLCQYHILRAVVAKCKRCIPNTGKWKKVEN